MGLQIPFSWCPPPWPPGWAGACCLEGREDQTEVRADTVGKMPQWVGAVAMLSVPCFPGF